MKIQILFLSAVCAVANAGLHSHSAVLYGGHSAQIYDQHVPVIHNGVPEDTPEVQAAKAEHFQAYAKAAALAAKQPSDGQYREQSGHGHYGTTQVVYKSYQNQAPQYYTGADNYQHGNNYISLDSSAFAKPHHYRGKRGIYEYQYTEPQHIPIIGKGGVPEETPEVQAAKLQHFVAHASANSHDEYESNDNLLSSGYNYHEDSYHIPVINKHGVPEDTPDVKLARQQHLYAHYVTKTGDHSVSSQGHGYSEHEPVIGPNGVPYDTPEVQIAKAQHYEAHAKESAKHNQWAVPEGYGGYGDYESGYSHYH